MSEKSLNEMPANLRDLYDKGIAAMQKQNYDYAVALFGQVVREEPAFFDARQALRAAQHRRTPGGRGLFKRFLGSASALTRGQLALRSNPTEAIQIAEDTLTHQPDNEAAHCLLAEAALALDLPKTAVLSLEIAFKNNAKDRKLAIKLATALAICGQRARAEKIYRDLLLIHPQDTELQQELKNLLANRTLSEGGYEALSDGSGSYRDVIRDKETAVQLEQESRTIKDEDVLDQLLHSQEAKLAQDPENIRLMRDIAELHLKRKDFDSAIQYFERILTTTQLIDPLILRAIQEAQLAKFDQRVAALNPAAPDYAEQKQSIEAARDVLRLEDVQKRAEANPSDLHIRYELGDLYFKAGRFSEAISALQKAQNHPNRRIPAMLLLAQCFAQRGMHDLAARKLQEAIREKQVFDAEKMELHYQLGSILEAMEREEEAIEQYKLIYEIDIGYRDVAEKVDTYYSRPT
jgi:tetratricopeptide (TPR) repeat protein